MPVSIAECMPETPVTAKKLFNQILFRLYSFNSDIYVIFYSTVPFVRCGWEFSIADLTFNFTLTCRSPALSGNHYSDYQLFLYQTISEHREKGIPFAAIAEWLNNKGYLTVRGKKFRGTHVHSILKKR